MPNLSPDATQLSSRSFGLFVASMIVFNSILLGLDVKRNKSELETQADSGDCGLPSVGVLGVPGTNNSDTNNNTSNNSNNNNSNNNNTVITIIVINNNNNNRSSNNNLL